MLTEEPQMLDIRELASTSTQAFNAGVARCQFLLRLSLEPFCLLCSLLVLKDWLFSSVDPYPFAAAADISGAAVAMFIALFYLKAHLWLLAPLGATLLWWGTSDWNWQIVWVTLSTGLLAFGLRLFPMRLMLAKWIGLIVLNAYGLFLIWTRLGIGELWSADPDFLLGRGLGAGTGMVFSSFGARLAYEQGSLLVVALSLLLTSALLYGVVVLAAGGAFSSSVTRAGLSAGGLGLLIGMLSTSAQQSPFCTVDSLAGTWMLTISISALGLATLQRELNSKKCSDLVPLDTKKTRFRISACQTSCFLFAAGSVALFVCHEIIGTRVFSLNRSTVISESTFSPLSQISSSMQDATVAMEDGHFYSHHGFDWIAIHRALRVDLRDGRVEQGGSTITQQLAKNLFLTNDRTIIRKLEEAAYTAELEHDLSKHRILELYLNKIDYGCGQHGITAAATYYFHETPAQLTLAQSALLVGLVPAPPQTPDGVNLSQLAQGQQTALSRVAFFFPGRYSSAELTASSFSSLDRSVYPFKDAWDRGATDTIPAIWHGISFFFYASPDEPGSIDHVSSSLKPALADFLEDAKRQYGLTGIDHLGVYNDRTMRQSQTAISAHAFGQAIDISGFRFKGGFQVRVKDHADPRVAARLAPIEALLKQHFPIVVDWRDDPLRHQTHFHCEVRGPRTVKGSRTRSFTVQSLGTVASTLASDAKLPGVNFSSMGRLRL